MALLLRRWRTTVLLALIAMYLGIFLVMGLSFKLQIIELSLLALPWAAWLNRFLDPVSVPSA